MDSNHTDGLDAYYEDSGALQSLSDDDTAVEILVRDLEHELRELVHHYHVPHGDLEKLLQVLFSD